MFLNIKNKKNKKTKKSKINLKDNISDEPVGPIDPSQPELYVDDLDLENFYKEHFFRGYSNNGAPVASNEPTELKNEILSAYKRFEDSGKNQTITITNESLDTPTYVLNLKNTYRIQTGEKLCVKPTQAPIQPVGKETCDDITCGSDQICIDYKAQEYTNLTAWCKTDKCGEGNVCEQGQDCDVDSGTCVQICGIGDEKKACTVDQICVDNKCVDATCGAQTCKQGEECIDNTCVKSETLKCEYLSPSTFTINIGKDTPKIPLKGGAIPPDSNPDDPEVKKKS